MTRTIPPVATAIVLIAVATMVALGFWQLQRKAEKEALLARYARAVTMSSDARWPLTLEDTGSVLYRHSRIDCVAIGSIEAMAGRSHNGQTGWAHVAQCRLASGQDAPIALGWSARPESPQWAGGPVSGWIGPAGKRGIRLVASPPQAGLEQLAAPNPKTVPNNHLSYAVQWFAFAGTALIIYALALRRRWRGH